MAVWQGRSRRSRSKFLKVYYYSFEVVSINFGKMSGRCAGPTKDPHNPTIQPSGFERRYQAVSASVAAGRAFDFVVVGAGAAGCAFVSRVAQAGASVLLLEAGPEAQCDPAVTVPNRCFGLWRSEVDWGFRSDPQSALEPAGRAMELEQGKTLGGSTAINYMVWVRGPRPDFEFWATEHGCTGWDYQSVVPHFDRVERALGAAAGHRHTEHPIFPETAAFLRWDLCVFLWCGGAVVR